MTLSYKTHAATATTGDVSGQPLGYSFNFPSLSANDITVTVGGNTKTITTDYTVENWTADAGNNPYIKFTSSTARGSGTIRISRGTTSTSPTHDFQVGSAIKAADLNSCNKQNIYLAQENRDSINALALGDASSAIQIDSQNIKNLTIQAIDLATDAVETDKIKDLNVTTGKLADNAVTNNKVDTNAAIQGTKISPNFGSQNITTTGTIASGDITISDQNPKVVFTDTNNNPDYTLIANNGEFLIRDDTNDAIRLQVNTDGHVDVTGNLDVGAGADVTGNLTVSGDATFNNGISSNGKDVYTNNGAFITLDHPHDPFKTDRSTSTNVDHIWHDDGDNAWNFCSDTDYKTTGNSKVKAGSFYGDGANITGIISGIKQVKEGSSTGQSSRTSDSFGDKTSVSITGTTSSSRVLVISTYRVWSSTPYQSSTRYAEVRTTRGDSSTFSGNTYDTHINAAGASDNNAYHTSFLWDVSTSSGTRTYKIRYRKYGSGTAYISQARIMAIEFRPT